MTPSADTALALPVVEALLTAVGDAALVVDADGRLVAWNETAAALFGFGPESRGTDFGLPVTPGPPVDVDLRTARGIRSGELRVAEYEGDGAVQRLVVLRDVTAERTPELIGLEQTDPVIRRLPATEIIDRVLADFPDTAVRIAAGAVVEGDVEHLTGALRAVVENGFVHGAPPVVVEGRVDGSWTELRVRDAGPGVPPRHVEDVFASGWQLAHDPNAPRFGLGLTLARKLVAANHGNMWCEHSARGACVVLRVPGGGSGD